MPDARSHRRTLRSAAAVASLVAMIATGLTACTAAAPKPQTAAVKSGGSVVIGAEQEPDCADWIATCAGSIWGTYIMQIPTLPAAFDTRRVNGTWVPQPSDLLAGMPTTTVSGTTQTITYKINPKAVWSDKQPITSADFKYTALQERDGDDIFDKTGYDRIRSIATPDSETAVLTLNTPYAGWRVLFSTLLPSHLLQGKSRASIMKNGYTFSGGPWKIQSWKRGTSVTLVPNANYWGAKPKLDKVTFDFLPDTTAAFQALKSGQVDALYPSPQLDAISQIKAGLPGIRSQVDADSGAVEAIWLNNAAAPFNSVAVRQALAYSIDRTAIVSRLFGSLGVKAPQQSFNSPIVGAYAGTAFSTYHLDLAKVTSLMQGDGWTKNANSVWQKAGKTASFTMLTLAGNKRRDLTTQVIQAQVAKAGFDMKIKSVTPADLFGTTAPHGDFQAGLWSIVDTFPDPTISSSFLSGNIPSAANKFSGINFVRASVPELDGLLRQVDSDVNTTSRIALSKQADGVIARDVPALPIDTVPNVLLWSDKVGGPLAINPVEGPFWNLAQWGIAG